jgi:glycosyltransferase involved in cell wall biosynthesis
MSVELERAGSDAFHDAKGAVDVVHAHDWIALPAAIALSHAFQSPLVVTLHSIESQRSGGSRSPYLEAIRKIEWQGAFEAARVIVDREAMLAEVVREYQVPEQKVDIIDPAGREAVALALKAYREACL